jgi:hypothetical protein
MPQFSRKQQLEAERLQIEYAQKNPRVRPCYRPRPGLCPECGKVALLFTRSLRCGSCQHARKMERQRERRAQRTPVPKPRRACEHCGQAFQPQRVTARFCSPKCRVYFSRKR